MRRRTTVVKGESVALPDGSSAKGDKSGSKKSKTVASVHVEDAAGKLLNLHRALAEVPPPAPTVDLFARFQQKKNDFGSEWLMLHEEAAPMAPLIPPKLSEKLRDHQGTMQKERGGVDVDVGRCVSVGAATAAVDASHENEDGNDTLRKEATERTPDLHLHQCPSKTDSSEDGIHGDFLSLSSFRGTKDAVMKSDLQATLQMTDEGGVMTSSTAPANGIRRTGSGEHFSSFSASAQLRVVPLWSVERFTKHGEYATNVLIALHQEICDFVAYLRPSQAEVSMRRIIQTKVHRIAKRLWPECEPVAYGSMTTHLLLPLSDLDMTLLNVPIGTEEALTLLAREINRENLCHAAYPQLILKTKVPLVKFQHRTSMLDVDISINAADGRRNSAIVVDLLNAFPEARPLTIVVKYFLQQRGMHEPYHGGLGSFATTLLVISFLQHHPIYNNCPAERAYSGLGRLLVDFFRYYGLYFQYNRCGISLLDGGYYFRRTDMSTQAPSQMMGQRFAPLGPPQILLEDPGCTQNNAASSLRTFHVISSVFSHAYMALTGLFDKPSDGLKSFSPDATEISRRPTLLSRILHVDAPSVERRQLVAAAYKKVMEDPEEREEMQRISAQYEEENMRMLKGMPPKSTGTFSIPSTYQGRKRHRQSDQDTIKEAGTTTTSSSSGSRGSNSDSSSSSCGSGSSNDSSVRIVSHQFRH